MEKETVIGRIVTTPSESDGTARFIVSNTSGDGAKMRHEIEAIGMQARICREHMNVGDLCCIVGRIDVSCGYRRIVAERIAFLADTRANSIKQKKQPWEIGMRRGKEYRVTRG